VSEGRLIKGVWRKKQWLGFKAIERMSQVWLQRALDEGCFSWDHVLLKLLGVILQASCAARAGDIARSPFYKGMECLCWKHVQMTLTDRRPPLSVQNMTLKLSLDYTKGHK